MVGERRIWEGLIESSAAAILVLAAGDEGEGGDSELLHKKGPISLGENSLVAGMHGDGGGDGRSSLERRGDDGDTVARGGACAFLVLALGGGWEGEEW